jgi:hypothetical protein
MRRSKVVRIQNSGVRSQNRNCFSSVFCILTSVFLVLGLSSVAYAGHLEPFKSTPIPEKNPQTPEKIELGKQLFFDRRLSGDGTMSCATCHIPELAFTDGQDISLSYPTTRNWRNSPTLINVAFQKYLFHDGRVQTLEDQALFPVMSAFEMNKNLDYLEEQIRQVAEYEHAFKTVFGTGEVSRRRLVHKADRRPGRRELRLEHLSRLLGEETRDHESNQPERRDDQGDENKAKPPDVGDVLVPRDDGDPTQPHGSLS